MAEVEPLPQPVSSYGMNVWLTYYKASGWLRGMSVAEPEVDDDTAKVANPEVVLKGADKWNRSQADSFSQTVADTPRNCKYDAVLKKVRPATEAELLARAADIQPVIAKQWKARQKAETTTFATEVMLRTIARAAGRTLAQVRAARNAAIDDINDNAVPNSET